MKRFALHLVLFLLVLSLINGYFYQIVFENYYSEYENVDLHHSTYLLADSHGLAIDKENSQEKFYNFSAGSDSYIDMKRKLQYLAENTEIERLIISVDNHTLSKYRDNKHNSDRSVFYAKWDEHPSLYAYIKDRYLVRFIPLLSAKSRDIVKGYLNLEFEEKKPRRDWKELPARRKMSRSINRVRQQFPQPDPSLKQQKALSEIVDICKGHKIELIGIKFPLSNEYLEALGDSDYEADAFLVSNQIKVLDFSKYFAEEPTVFKNQDHIDEKGGKILSSKIYSLLKKKESPTLYQVF